jgi:hypothetical protein
MNSIRFLKNSFSQRTQKNKDAAIFSSKKPCCALSKSLRSLRETK